MLANRKRQPRLAGSTDAGQRQQSVASLVKQAVDLGEFLGSAEKGR